MNFWLTLILDGKESRRVVQVNSGVESVSVYGPEFHWLSGLLRKGIAQLERHTGTVASSDILLKR